ncbi:uncharacterized protein LOC134848237 [Symsagittifera roscoffensis]|uniref:uncharacterized protein LOC134848237 n=1 Tax=Symsagittifera roscoffensis TaxID=84072 RepID=UPI00307BEC32
MMTVSMMDCANVLLWLSVSALLFGEVLREVDASDDKTKGEGEGWDQGGGEKTGGVLERDQLLQNQMRDKRALRDSKGAALVNAIKDWKQKNVPIRKFSLTNVKHVLACYNVCSTASPNPPPTPPSKGPGGAASGADQANQGGAGRVRRLQDMGDMDCKCASNLFQQGNEQQFVPCCDKLNTWIKASLTDEEQLKKIWRVSEGSEKDAFKDFTGQVQQCLDGKLSGDFNVRADKLGGSGKLGDTTMTLKLATLLTPVLLNRITTTPTMAGTNGMDK